MQNKNSNFAKKNSELSVKDLFRRLKKHLDVDSDGDLCKILEIPQSTLSSWKNRNTLDIHTIYNRCYGVDFNVLIYGDNNTHEPQTQIVQENTEKFTYTKEELETLIKAAKFEVFEKVYDKILNKELP